MWIRQCERCHRNAELIEKIRGSITPSYETGHIMRLREPSPRGSCEASKASYQAVDELW